MKEKILITSALPYANGQIHFGHIAGAFLPADCYARFKRLSDYDVLYLCGSDEFGVAITLSAEKEGRTPQEQVDLFHGLNQTLLSNMNISFDHYSRTTWKDHGETVQEFFLDLLDKDHIEEKITKQLYSESENRFLADRYVQGTCPKCGFDKARGDECQACGASYEATDLINPTSKVSGQPLILKETNHWFLRFDHFKQELTKWIATKQWKPNVVNFALSYIKDLKPRAITRDSQWGIPVPLEHAKGKVFYVWFDAPIGYISAAKDWAQLQGDKELWKRYWLDPKTKYVQFIGKDNIPFHSVFFPAMVMGQNIPYKLVDELPANEFYNLEGKKFSKSEGWYIYLDAFFAEFDVDQIRYVIASNAPENQDSEFTFKDFQSRCNADLVGKFGNFIHRVLTFVQQKAGGKVPSSLSLNEEDVAFMQKIQELIHSCSSAYENFQLRKASQYIMELAQAGNVYFDAKKPWKAAKDPVCFDDMQSTLYCCLECIKSMALVTYPIMPSIAEKIESLLGFSTKSLLGLGWNEIVNLRLKEGNAMPKPQVLFEKIEDERIQPFLDKLYASVQQPKQPNESYYPLKPEIAIEDVKKVDLRVGVICSAERVVKSKKLLKLLVDIGQEKRSIVAGIGEGLEDLNVLIGKNVVVVVNLKAAKLMGVESQGMLLAAKGTQGFDLPVCDGSLPGDPVA